MCQSNASKYCSTHCEQETFEACKPICESQIGASCEIGCSAGSPAQSVYQTCVSDCTYREVYRCTSECVDNRRSICDNECEQIALTECTSKVLSRCEQDCGESDQYLSCKSECEDTCIPEAWEISDCSDFPLELMQMNITYDEDCPLDVLQNFLDLSLDGNSDCHWGKGGSEYQNRIYCAITNTELLMQGHKNHTYSLTYSCERKSTYELPCSEFYGSTVMCSIGGDEYTVEVSDFTYDLSDKECYHSPLYS